MRNIKMASSEEIRKYINLFESIMISETSASEEYANKIQAPEGFTKEEGHGSVSVGGHIDTKSHRGEQFGDEIRYVKLESDDIKIYFNIVIDDNGNVMASGHTNFNTPTGWKTFSRYGVGDSFNISDGMWGDHKIDDDPSVVIDEQIKKAEKSIAKNQDSVIVPGLDSTFTVTPQQKEFITKKLQARKAYTFVPAGFGTGYSLSTWQPHKNMGPEAASPLAPKELSDFFSVPELYVTKQDFD